ncbi:MAG: glycosyltransferase [Deltaproteobacteria bacterium]|nr:glycosyltransferase [Deltaproteobacteria bacterium]
MPASETEAPKSPPDRRLLIFVITYHADSTLEWVLDRIPSNVFVQFDCEVLIVDDASTDRTFEIGREYQQSHPEMRMTVLRNEHNQGYGGNQKVGYAFAIANGFDYVAMLHGDGQYAPEALPELLRPFSSGADAVFGSRMMMKGAALQGGMPLYKFLGNKVLTRAQNLMLRTNLSEFHSGYRIYRVSTLSSLPIRLNANDFHFDTEIIIQLINAGARIVEVPIPTYYGDEICRVDGLRYAKNVLLATFRNTLHRSGLLHQRRFDVEPDSNEHYTLKLGYPSSHTYAIAAVPAGAKVLDLGAGPGGLAKLLAKKGCKMAVVDKVAPNEPSADIEVYLQDLEEQPKYPVAEYEYILLMDVIEHLGSPERFLAGLRAEFDYRPKHLVLSTPNVAFFVQRLTLLLGQFNYGKAGILDRTHTRLFTFGSIVRLLEDEGFRVKSARGVPAPFPKVLGDGLIGQSAVAINLGLIRISKTLFSYQIFIEADATPDVDFVLRNTQQASKRRAAERPRTEPGTG